MQILLIDCNWNICCTNMQLYFVRCAIYSRVLKNTIRKILSTAYVYLNCLDSSWCDERTKPIWQKTQIIKFQRMIVIQWYNANDFYIMYCYNLKIHKIFIAIQPNKNYELFLVVRNLFDLYLCNAYYLYLFGVIESIL